MDEEPLDDDERAIELSSIAAIYPEIRIRPGPEFRASIDVPVVPSAPVKAHFARCDPPLPTPPAEAGGSHDVEITDGANGQRQAGLGNRPDNCYLSNLPSLKLDIGLPRGYPSACPPSFSITTSPKWLPDEIVYNLLVDGEKLWEDFGREMMVYSYIDHLQQCAENVFGLRYDPEDHVSFPREMMIELLNFDQRAQREKFERETFVCGICLEHKKGAFCHRLLLCSHVFCVQCLQDFFTSSIREGNIASVKCAAPGCGSQQQGPTNGRKRQDRTLSPSELLQIPLAADIVYRYAFLKRKNILESDKSTIYCPRKWCQGAARSKKHPKPVNLILDNLEPPDTTDAEGGDDDDVQSADPPATEDKLPPVSERLAVCEDCDYAFCSVCKRGWHGELVNCYPRHQAELTAEEKATIEFLELYTTACPSCSARCQKTHGCNHMICFKCNTHFCYLCSSWLLPAQPYAHFNKPKSPCYMRLWEGEAGDGGPMPIAGDQWDISDDED